MPERELKEVGGWPFSKFTKVDSSRITHAAYFGSSLYLLFRGQKAYVYYNVNQDVFQALVESSSPGSYFQNHILGFYKYDKVSAI